MNISAVFVAIFLVIISIILRYLVIWRLKYGNAIVFIVWLVFFFLGGLILSIMLEEAPGTYDPTIAQRYGSVMFVLFLVWTTEETVKAVKKVREQRRQ